MPAAAPAQLASPRQRMLAEECPMCLAPPGEPCHGTDLAARLGHWTRWAAAAQTQSERPR